MQSCCPLQAEKQEADRKSGELQEQFDELLAEAKTVSAEAAAALEEATRKSQEEVQASKVRCFLRNITGDDLAGSSVLPSRNRAGQVLKVLCTWNWLWA